MLVLWLVVVGRLLVLLLDIDRVHEDRGVNIWSLVVWAGVRHAPSVVVAARNRQSNWVTISVDVDLSNSRPIDVVDLANNN